MLGQSHLLLFLLFMAAAESRATSQATASAVLQLVPYPVSLVTRPGAFRLDSATVIAVSDVADDELLRLARHAAEIVEQGAGIEVRVSTSRREAAGAGVLLLALSSNERGRSAEGYRMEVGGNGASIAASTHAGLFYGLQTFRQLLAGSPSAEPGVRSIPGVSIEDEPRFVYRGMHLDVGRHFFPVEFVKKYIDLLAMYKMNTFHWHLTEDQGWRIEIKKYPRLTQVGGFRKETILEKNFDPYIGDRIPYGGYYTQEEIRGVVAYAASRYVTIIPEIEMPGHSKAALAAYPELACTEGPFEAATVWGVHEDIYCPSERTFAFLQDVLSEVIDLFPGRYIHIGGDEAPKRRWEESETAQEVMRREGLADEHELQSYFIRRIESFLLANGRRLIGWDEILEGGLAPQATVMSWRGTEGGIEAARQGHDVIMTPTSHVYFDYYQGDPNFEPLAIGGLTPLEKVYSFEPVPDELTAEQARHILGAQGNVWTEYMKTSQYVEYMVFPRLLALAEVLWSPATARDWDRFAGSLSTQFAILDGKRVNYRVPHVRGLDRDRLTLEDEIQVPLQSLVTGAQIRYTTDGSDPTERAPLYQGPFRLTVADSGVEVRARAYLPNGRVSNPRAARFARTELLPALALDADELEPGLRYSYYEADLASVGGLAGLTPVRTGTAKAVTVSGDERDENFGLEFQGYIRVPESAVYTFVLTSDDGSQLLIGDVTIIDNDGYHVPLEKAGMIALAAGYHAITVRYFQGGGGKDLQLSARVGADAELDLESALFRSK
ncbi:MAG: family 20 glycosylhydrolase [Gemmatimonadota bacterium]|nr:MAG: family 20 glycosylhydrolase [Gemmatimonadota bacterium]